MLNLLNCLAPLARLLRWQLALLTLAGLMAAGAWPALAAESAGLHDSAEVDFPDGIAFTLEIPAAEASSETQLRYRLQGNTAWSHAYPDRWEGDGQVAARYFLKTSGNDYLPPGSVIEYYYQLTDSAGGVVTTPRQSVEFMDTRFAWQETSIGFLTLLHHDIPQGRLDALAPQVEARLEHVRRLLSLDEPKPIRGFLYVNRADAQAAFPQLGRAVEQHVFAGFAFPSRWVFVGLGSDPNLIVHEATHILLAQALGNNSRAAPAWLDEGFASYAEPNSAPYSGASLAGNTPPLRAMSQVSGSTTEIQLFYQKSESVVSYLIKTHGQAAFQDFLAGLSNGASVNAALTQAYGFDADALDRQWASSDTPGRPVPLPGGPASINPFVYFDAWLLGLLGLTLVAAVTARYLLGKLRPRQPADPEEGLQPWEDPDLADRYNPDDFPPPRR